MVLNAYSVLDLFLVCLRLLIACLVLWFSMASWRRDRGGSSLETKQFLEDRGYLLNLLAIVLLGLNLISWPFFYLLLQSYVPQWPGVMCIYGVTQIGAGSHGTSRFLPGLVRTLQVTKPWLVFLAGAWGVLYLINRRTSTAPLGRRVLVALTILGLCGVADAAVEGAYLVIPKTEEFLSVGCCTGNFGGGAERFLPPALLGDDFHDGLSGAYYVLNLSLVLALFLLAGGWTRPATRLELMLVLLGALVSLPISALFLVEIVAPALLHLPYHHCPYDLLPQVPESMVGVGLYFMGCFAAGWACLAAWFARSPETQPFLGDFNRKLLFLGLLGYSGSLVLMAVELALSSSGTR